MSTISNLPSIRELVSDIFRNGKLIVAALLIPPIIAVGLAFVLPKEYQADAKLLIKPGREFLPSTNLGQNENGLPVTTMAEVIKSETEILSSQDLAEDVLSKLGITGVFPDLKADAGAAAPSLDRAIAIFDQNLSAYPIELSNVVQVSFRSQHPEVATKVLGILLADFQARHVTLYSNTLSTPIQGQITEKQDELQALDAKRIQYQNANGAYSIPEQRASLIQQRAAIATQLQTAEIQNEALQQQVTYLKKSKASTPATAPIETETDPTSATSGSALSDVMALKQKEQELLQHYQPTAPAVVAIRNQIAQAQQFLDATQSGNSKRVRTGANPLAASIDQQLLAAEAALTPILSQIEGYKAQMVSLDDTLKKLQDNELEVNNLQRQIDSLTADLNALRSSLDQARLAENMDQAKVSSVSIIDAPRLEPKPVFPRKTFFAAAGLAFGVGLSALIILVSVSFGNTIITVEGAERILGVPVVAALPRVKAQPAE